MKYSNRLSVAQIDGRKIHGLPTQSDGPPEDEPAGKKPRQRTNKQPHEEWRSMELRAKRDEKFAAEQLQTGTEA